VMTSSNCSSRQDHSFKYLTAPLTMFPLAAARPRAPVRNRRENNYSAKTKLFNFHKVVPEI
jgi:hypothetical protein